MKYLLILLFTLGLCATAGGGTHPHGIFSADSVRCRGGSNVDSLSAKATREDKTSEVRVYSEGETWICWGWTVDTTPLKPKPSWASCSDSLAARVERVEKRQTSLYLVGIEYSLLLYLMLFVFQIILLWDHKRKRITEAHKYQ